MMRMRSMLSTTNAFKPGQSFQQATQPIPYNRPQTPYEMMPDENINVEVEQPQDTQSGALKRIYDIMANMPQREPQGKLSKIGGAMMAFGGRSPEDIDQLTNRGYYNKLRDIGMQLDPLLKAGKLEADTVSAQAMADYRARTAGAAETRAGTGAFNAQTNAADKTADNLRADKALELKQKLADWPDSELRRSPGMPDQLIDKRTGRVIAEYAVGTLRQDQYEALKSSNRMKEIGAQAAGQAAVKATPSYSDLHPQPNANRDEAQVELRAATLIRENPKMADWVTKDPNTGQWVIAAPDPPNSWGFGGNGLTQDMYDKIKNYLNNGIAPGTAPAPGGNIPPVQPVPQGQGQGNTVNQTPIGGNNPPPQQQGGDKRARAIAALEGAGKLVNEQTIAAVMARMK